MISLNINSLFFIIVRIVVAGLLFWALDIHPDSYYMLLRWLVFIVAAMTAFKAFKLVDKSLWIRVLGCIIFASIAVLFNPVAHIHLTRTIWQNADIATAVLFLASIIIIRK
ncbi:MAG: hypothetical protein ACD_20C00137G0005 [uncultured bacterium]|nr:MAG: hypothetical protein ACD_20C00137G0005 [uncultured bacterium]HBH19061.1 hypothetical protein [Cyanobacteria bacterium UBA9579]